MSKERLWHPKRASFTATILAAVFIGLSACSPTHEATYLPPETPTISSSLPPEEKLPEIEQQIIEEEIKRLLDKYPQDSIVRIVYSEKPPTQLSPIFKYPIEIGFIGPTTYARTSYSDAKWSQQKRFRYFLERDSSLEDYATLESVRVSIAFSPYWLQSENDEVKESAIEKEAIGLALWEGFSKIAINTYLAQGRIEKIDPSVSDREIALTLAYLLLEENINVRKLFDYAAYLPILQRVGRLISQNNNTTIIKELRLSNIFTIYQMAKDRKIPIQQIKPWSQEFWTLAFSPESPWVKMILDPSIPGQTS